MNKWLKLYFLFLRLCDKLQGKRPVDINSLPPERQEKVNGIRAQLEADTYDLDGKFSVLQSV